VDEAAEEIVAFDRRGAWRIGSVDRFGRVGFVNSAALDLQGNRGGGRKAWLAIGPGRRAGDGRFTPLPDRLEQEARPTERLHPREELSICPAANLGSNGTAEPLQSSAIQRR
jgi:hypothetical protein